jgi:rubredoxin
VYKRKLALTVLDQHLSDLSNLYYDQLGLNNLIGTELKSDESQQESTVNTTYWVQQCQKCFTVYDEHYGEPENGIMPGVPFDSLSPAYTCPVCDAAKADFITINFQTLATFGT